MTRLVEMRVDDGLARVAHDHIYVTVVVMSYTKGSNEGSHRKNSVSYELSMSFTPYDG